MHVITVVTHDTPHTKEHTIHLPVVIDAMQESDWYQGEIFVQRTNPLFQVPGYAGEYEEPFTETIVIFYDSSAHQRGLIINIFGDDFIDALDNDELPFACDDARLNEIIAELIRCAG